MPNVEESNNARSAGFDIEDKEALIAHAMKVSRERTRVEALQLDEQIKARQALLESMKPEEQARLAQHLKSLPKALPMDLPLRGRWDPILPTTISYQVMRPPFSTDWWSAPLRAGSGPFHLTIPCVNVSTLARLGLTAVSAEGILSEGALSVQAAIGEFFNASCQKHEDWFLGEANRAFAAMGTSVDTGIALPSPGLISIGVDFEMQGQVGWSNFLFPGEPGSGLGLVGFIGIAGLSFQTYDNAQNTTQDATERFLLGSASAFFPGDVDRKPTFTLSHLVFLPKTPSGTLRYSFGISADLTAFRSVPIENGGYPGFAHANLTVPGTPGPLQPGTPLKVKEVRVAISLWP